MADVKYPEVEVNLVGQDGNAFNVIGLVGQGLKRAGVPSAEVTEFNNQAFAAEDYNHLLRIAMSWVTVN